MKESRELADPITYILSRLKKGEDVRMFDILLACDDWDKIKRKKPVAWADVDYNGKIANIRLTKGEDCNPYTSVGLYLR